jgi:predicted Zn-dependent protease
MARLQARINMEICAALAFRDTDAAIAHMWRFLAHPFESRRNRLWRIAYLHEGVGEIDQALAVYALMVSEYRQQGDLKNAEMFLREMVKAAPDRPCYQRQLAEIYLEMDWRDHAVREFGILEQLHWRQGDIEAAQMTAAKVVELAREPLRKCSPTDETQAVESEDVIDFTDSFGSDDGG